MLCARPLFRRVFSCSLDSTRSHLHDRQGQDPDKIALYEIVIVGTEYRESGSGVVACVEKTGKNAKTREKIVAARKRNPDKLWSDHLVYADRFLMTGPCEPLISLN